MHLSLPFSPPQYHIFSFPSFFLLLLLLLPWNPSQSSSQLQVPSCVLRQEHQRFSLEQTRLPDHQEQKEDDHEAIITEHDQERENQAFWSHAPKGFCPSLRFISLPQWIPRLSRHLLRSFCIESLGNDVHFGLPRGRTLEPDDQEYGFVSWSIFCWSALSLYVSSWDFCYSFCLLIRQLLIDKKG